MQFKTVFDHNITKIAALSHLVVASTPQRFAYAREIPLNYQIVVNSEFIKEHVYVLFLSNSQINN